jgi:hypothetical protein
VSQRGSGYERKAWDLYTTPGWVTRAVIDHLPWVGGCCWEPAAGTGAMADVLKSHFDPVITTDAQQGESFFEFECAGEAKAIITNPPYDQAPAFARHALKLMRPCNGMVALLLRVDFDSGKTRPDLFADCVAWYKKVVLLDRIMWFQGDKSPSYNHAWYVWSWRHEGPATIAYAAKGNSE